LGNIGHTRNRTKTNKTTRKKETSFVVNSYEYIKLY